MSIHLYYKQPLIQTVLELTESGWYRSISLYKFQSSIYTPIIETDDKYLCETDDW